MASPESGQGRKLQVDAGACLRAEPVVVETAVERDERIVRGCHDAELRIRGNAADIDALLTEWSNDIRLLGHVARSMYELDHYRYGH